MTDPARPLAVEAARVAPRARQTLYPEPFATQMKGRIKRQLGEVFGLTNFGVNLTRMSPGGVSAVRHSHGRQDELIYVLEGEPTLVTNAGETLLKPGMCAGFKAGTGDAHHLINRSDREVVYLEIGDRMPGDTVVYPDQDLAARLGADGQWTYTHKDGRPY